MWHPGMNEKTFMRLQEQEMRRQFDASRNFNANLGRLFNMIAEGTRRVWNLLASRLNKARYAANIVSPIPHRWF